MTDCNHWIPIILDETREKLDEERRTHQEDKRIAQNALNDIRAIINCAENKLDSPPLTLQEQMLGPSSIQRQQYEAMSEVGRRYGSLDSYRGSCDQNHWYARFGGLLGR